MWGNNRSMFEAFRKIFAELGEGGKHPGQFGEDDYRLASAALLVHAAGIDGGVSDAERARLRGVIKQRFKLDDEDADELLAEATEADRSAIDLYQFTPRPN